MVPLSVVGAWQSFECPGSRMRWRELPSGEIELEGIGIPRGDWPSDVDRLAPSILRWSAHYGVPAAYIAAICALETRGRNVCPQTDGKLCSSPECADKCLPGEGVGVMATVPSTARAALDRPDITARSLLADPDLAIQAGTAYLKQCLDRYGGDFMRAAVCYNAGSVRCGRGRPFGRTTDEDVCPDPRGWGVVLGCVYSPKADYRCEPSRSGRGPYVCTNDYPYVAAAMLNEAIRRFGAPGEVTEAAAPVLAAGMPSGFGRGTLFMLGLVLGFQAFRALERHVTSRRQAG